MQEKGGKVRRHKINAAGEYTGQHEVERERVGRPFGSHKKQKRGDRKVKDVGGSSERPKWLLPPLKESSATRGTDQESIKENYHHNKSDRRASDN